MQYQYWLSNIEGIGSVTIHKLLKQTGKAEELYFLSAKQILSIDGVGKKEKEQILESRQKWKLTEEWEKFLETGNTDCRIIFVLGEASLTELISFL